MVGILFRAGEPNAAIQAMIDAAPRSGRSSRTGRRYGSVRLPARRSRILLPTQAPMTTPPYTEGVQWRVISEVLEASEEQVTQLAALTGGGTNSRPIQPLNGREIKAHCAG